MRFSLRVASLACAGLGLGLGAWAQKAPAPLYKNPQAPLEQRVKDLMGRMTLEEKVAQTHCLWIDKKVFWDKKGNFDPALAKKAIPHGLGQIGRINEVANSISAGRKPRETAELANTVQKYFVTQTRLGIPVIFHEEALHGNQAPEATHFPSPLGMASSWNPDLLSRIFTTVAEEVRLRGGHQVLAPVVDLGRDPRWGRTEETYGEDPYLTSRLGVAVVKAFQGNGPVIGPKNVASTLKHFAVHGMPEGGVNIGPSFADERTMREVYLPAFKAGIQEGGVSAIMPCYNENAGVPAHANRWLLTDLLRKEWGFTGLVVSDYFAVNELRTLHKIVAPTDTASAAYRAMNAGVDIELPDRLAYTKLPELLASGRLPQAALDSAVARVLRLKFRLGLFENPYTDPVQAEKVIGSEQNRDIALKAAHEAMVLLKNEGNLLPLDPNKVKTLAIIGPNADRCILGGYSNKPRFSVTPLQAIRQAYGDKIKVLYAEGSRITDKGDWFSDTVLASKPEENYQRIKEAVEIARQADVVILCLGGNEATSREAWAYNHLGDLTTLELLGQQNELVEAITALKKPTAAFVFSGPPLALTKLQAQVHALVQSWYLGQETGRAMADVLFGVVNPSGKLPISMPRSAGHLPCYYNYKPTARRGYLFDEVKPLYPFGHGLSYTQFALKNPKLSQASVSVAALGKQPVQISVEVSNTGSRSGAEVVQLYIRDEYSEVTRPVKELKGFQKVFLKPGESQTVTFTIAPEHLAYYDLAMKYRVEPGTFTLMLGTSSETSLSQTLTVTEK